MAAGAAAADASSQPSLRDRLLASPRFQRWAAAFPLTRPMARRRARALFDLCAGFVYSQALLAAVRLGVCDILLEGPQPPEELARRLSLPPDGAARLLHAATALRLTRRQRDGRFALGSLGAALAGNPGIAAMVRHHALLYDDLHDPVALLRGEAGPASLQALWPYAGHARPQDLRPEEIAAYSDLMAASLPLVAADVLAAYRFERHRCLLDLGGGDGAFLAAVAAAAPKLRLALFDLPAVADRARARFAQAGLAQRAQTFGGDLRTDPLPRGADVDLADPRDPRPRRRRRAGDPGGRAAGAAGGRHAAAGGADGGDPRRRGGGRLFRALPAGDGQRPAAQCRSAGPSAAPGRIRAGPFAADPPANAGAGSSGALLNEICHPCVNHS